MQSTFCINSVAHWLGDAPYDDAQTPRDHLLSALLTMGEGYHNFHHQFPMDYRNAVRWYQYDPTKWFIALCACIRLASHLRVFPRNEIAKGHLAMELKRLKATQDTLAWPPPRAALPVVSWATCSRAVTILCPTLLTVYSSPGRGPNAAACAHSRVHPRCVDVRRPASWGQALSHR